MEDWFEKYPIFIVLLREIDPCTVCMSVAKAQLKPWVWARALARAQASIKGLVEGFRCQIPPRTLPRKYSALWKAPPCDFRREVLPIRLDSSRVALIFFWLLGSFPSKPSPSCEWICVASKTSLLFLIYASLFLGLPWYVTPLFSCLPVFANLVCKKKCTNKFSVIEQVLTKRLLA
jgi:hypothetical protein